MPARRPRAWWVYLVRAADGSLYTGVSTDVVRRVREHNAGRGSKSLKGRLPVSLVHREKASGRPAALRREAEIKRWNRPRKLELISAARQKRA